MDTQSGDPEVQDQAVRRMGSAADIPASQAQVAATGIPSSSSAIALHIAPGAAKSAVARAAPLEARNRPKLTVPGKSESIAPLLVGEESVASTSRDQAMMAPTP